MPTILILYPPEFRCYSKLRRKVSGITCRLSDATLVCPSDPYGYNKCLVGEVDAFTTLCLERYWKDNIQITHAIVFDDGEEFHDEIVALREAGIILRTVRIKITRVINIKQSPNQTLELNPENYEYIGRGSYWGNPYSMFDEGESREEVIRKFKYDFDFDKFPNKEKRLVHRLAGKRLGCFCKPEKCHGDVIADYLNSWDDGK